ncbi:class I poly(R)-hydroxyalkanoic acid synthase [Chitiniphilus shinanonensis]|uniref:Class I poly(R)-hydroxyalkanoic acid synthase n=1 Tax=Chitiniphilus shinanonensis TaxID=553088 RepID=A0ABQ6BPN2_9NEIS|nr:class I poly(R)-hydroxyalkanoic acid synthase [Chitiniphilus shinanonensis]GLS03923.1 class I poly(R)-hydroxyalkanoic acid synthase [Chitiniphilus shinanonensis]
MLNPPNFQTLLQQLNDANRQWWQHWEHTSNSLGGAQAPAGSTAQASWLAALNSRPEWIEKQTEYYRAQLDLWLGLIGAKPPLKLIEPERGDRRFNAPEWEDPLFSFIKQNYLLTSKWLMESVSAAATDDGMREKIEFFTRQYVDAISPANFALTNPEVLKLAQETKGESLAAGMQKMLTDVQKGLITTTDESVFEVGRNLAVTPGAVVYENDLFQLLQYTPSTAKVYEVPLLIVPPCVNKYYIMDLQPENSMVRWVVEQGYTTFLVSWKSVQPEQGKLVWDDYIEQGVIRAAEVVREITRREKMNVLSFCIGGELVSTAIPVMQSRGLDWFESLTLMTVILDHSEPGDIKHFIDWNLINARKPKLAQGGVVSGKELARTFASLRANDLIWNYVVNNYLKGKTPPPFDLLYWNNDSANLALPMHTFFLENMYLKNNLTKPNSFSLCGVPIDLTRITLPTYVFAAREDHIVLWRSAYGTTRLFKGPLRFVLGASGHIAGTINPVTANKRNYWVNEELPADPEQWFEKAESRPGSWWQDWAAWLSPRAGKQVAAPKKLGNTKYKEIEPAPGRYVKERVD